MVMTGFKYFPSSHKLWIVYLVSSIHGLTLYIDEQLCALVNSYPRD